MNIKNIKNIFVRNIILYSSILLILSIKSNASYIDLDKSIINVFGGSTTNYFESVVETSDGGVVIAGYSNSTNFGVQNNSFTDAIIIKQDKNGNLQWIKNFGGSSNDYFYSVTTTLDGGIVAVGYTSSTDCGIENKGVYDSIIVKYDKNGNYLWSKSFGGSKPDYFKSVVGTSDGGVVAVGYSNSIDAGFESEGNNDAIIVKYDSEGNQEWVKNFGGSDDDYFESVIKTKNNEILVSGRSYSQNAEFANNGRADAIIIKYDNDGNQLWIKNFGGSADDQFDSIIETNDNGIVAVGRSISQNVGFEHKGSQDAIIVKFDNEGNQEWVNGFGGSMNEYFTSVTELKDGGFFAVGCSSSSNAGFINKGMFDSILIKYDSEGNQEWVKTFGGNQSDYFCSIIETSNKDIIIVGYTNSTDVGIINKGGTDAVIIKYNKSCKDNENVFDKIYELENLDNSVNLIKEIEEVRDLINSIDNEELKGYLNKKLDDININFGALESKNTTSNLDIYIKSENMLLINLSTNSITFEDYSGVENIEKTSAVKITINSSLPYQLNAYLVDEMYNSDKTKKIDIDRLNIKDSSSNDYKPFNNINEKLVLKDNCSNGNDNIHNIDLKLKGDFAYESDVYKTVIKFEAEQK